MHAIRYELIKQCETTGARLGRVHTPHGSFDTPAFMPVGTLGTVKGLLPSLVEATGAQIILSNTYHLMLRPGSELIAQMGGLHPWIGWDKPILTDSGGFQVFSLSDINKINDQGVSFKSHLDGRTIDMTPERSMQVQNELGSDIIMAFDDCPPASAPTDHQQAWAAAQEAKRTGKASPEDRKLADQPASRATGTSRVPLVDPAAYQQRVREACERSGRWLERCIKAHARTSEQGLFGIVQGGTDLDQRTWCVEDVCRHDLPGFAIGGVAVGEGYEELKRVVEHTAPLMPGDKPRYLMGVGYERDIFTAVRAGVDMFDCVLPTRNGRNGNAFTPTGQMRLRNAEHARDPRVIDETCDCPACREGAGFSRSYLRHLMVAGEMLGPILVSLHNLRHFQRLLLDIRQAIRDNAWSFAIGRWPVLAEAL